MTTQETQAHSLLPSRTLERTIASWRGLRAEIIKLTCHQPLQFERIERCHLLVALEEIQHYSGETSVEGLPKSTRRDLAHKLTFIPAGCPFSGWMKPRVSLQATLFFIDPELLAAQAVGGLVPLDLRPRLFFDDDQIWQTVDKLKAQIGHEDAEAAAYAQALAAVLAHEIMRLEPDGPELIAVRGGLAAWQQRRVVEFVETHLSEDISLAALAGLVQLSTYHFARAFKRSFGVPPHRYCIKRRIERAKTLLANPAASVVEVALELGFSGASAFAATFRRTTGRTPTDYRRSLA
jgi:AraC family transcriptional regulator